jgi:hypothetical protein
MSFRAFSPSHSTLAVFVSFDLWRTWGLKGPDCLHSKDSLPNSIWVVAGSLCHDSFTISDAATCCRCRGMNYSNLHLS